MDKLVLSNSNVEKDYAISNLSENLLIIRNPSIVSK